MLFLRVCKPVDQQTKHSSAKANEEIGRVLDWCWNFIEQYVARHAAADSTKKTHDQQPDYSITTIVRWIARNKHSVKSIDAGGEQVDIRKTRQIHFDTLLKNARPAYSREGQI